MSRPAFVFRRGIRLAGLLSALFLLVGLGLIGCSSSEDDDRDFDDGGLGHLADTAPRGDTTPEPDTSDNLAEEATGGEAPTWHGAIRSIVAKNCVQCHRQGGIAPFAMSTYAQAKSMAEPALRAIEAGRMPPWSPDPDCRRYKDERLMAQSEIDAFRRWVEGGTPEGEGDGAPAEPPADRQMPQADIVAKPEGAYTPPATKTDTYRCFLLDHTFEEETYGTASWVEPGHKPIVHHVLAFVVGPDEAAKMQQRSGRDGQPGFDCFGASTGGPVGWFVPGTEPRSYENDRGFLLPEGGRIMMQVHYNVLSAEPRPDRTTFHLKTRDAAPKQFVTTHGIAKRNIVIPAGDANSTHVQTLTNNSNQPWVIQELAGHMHLLGESIKLERVRADGSTECLLDIPEWDFQWQQFYSFRDGEAARIRPGESLRMTCTYDNSPANQPVVDGEQISTREVRWGEGTLDEMCLSYVSVLQDQPPQGGQQAACTNLETCRTSCHDADDYACVMACSYNEARCGSCLLDGFYGQGGCVSPACGQQAGAVTSCFQNCQKSAADGDALVGCMQRRCPTNWEALRSCVTGELASGTCSEVIRSCRGD